MHIFVGNLPPEFTDADLQSLFEPFGTVRSAVISMNKKTNISEGYGTVEMPGKAEARTAVAGLKGTEVKGKILQVKILKPDDPFHPSARPGFRPGAHAPVGGPVRAVGMNRRGGQRGS